MDRAAGEEDFAARCVSVANALRRRVGACDRLDRSATDIDVSLAARTAADAGAKSVAACRNGTVNDTHRTVPAGAAADARATAGGRSRVHGSAMDVNPALAVLASANAGCIASARRRYTPAVDVHFARAVRASADSRTV